MCGKFEQSETPRYYPDASSTHISEHLKTLTYNTPSVSASLQFLRDHGIVVEPACGVALAAVYEKVAALSGYKTVLVIVCGGVGSTADHLVELSRPECDAI